MRNMERMLQQRANVSRLYLRTNKEGKGLTPTEVTIETAEYVSSDNVKETNNGHNRLLKCVEKEVTKKKYNDNVKEHRAKD